MKRLIVLSTMMFIMTAGNSCKETPAETGNPLLAEWDTPMGVPPFDRISPEHYSEAFEETMRMHNEQIEAITASDEQPTFDNTILALDRAGRELSEISLIFTMVAAADTNEQMQRIEAEIMPELSAHYNDILLNDALFARIEDVYSRRATLGLDELQMRLLEKTRRDFVRAGALLDKADKARLKEIDSELAALSIRFGNNLLAETRDFKLLLDEEQVADLPEGVKSAAAEQAKQAGESGYMFTLDKPSMLPFLTYSPQRELREQLYKGYLSRCERGNERDNKQLIKEMTRLRAEKAHLLGFKSYAEYVTSDQMAGTPEAVYALLDQIWTPALERARGEMEEMTELLHEDLPEATLESWDWWYYAEKLRKKNYRLDEALVSQYLSADNVRNGIFFLANRLYGITFRPISVPKYNPECSAFEVLDVDNSHLGVLYFDLFPRAGKSGGAWCGYFTEQRYEDGKRVAPTVGIVRNFTRPVGDTPALLSIDETETLFHEFGHALHFLFADVRYRGLAEVEGDFVELPSQIMENWAFEEEILKQYATHYKTGEPMPDDLIAKIHKASLFNQGFTTTELVAAALLDMDIHSMQTYADFDPAEFEKYAMATRRGLIPQIEPRYRLPYFSHIFNGGYSSGYYFYLWAEVLDKDAFAAFKSGRDICDKQLAHSFRYDLLAQGGQHDGMDMYRKFRGADPDKTAMLRARGLYEEPELPADSLAGETPLDIDAETAEIETVDFEKL